MFFFACALGYFHVRINYMCISIVCTALLGRLAYMIGIDCMCANIHSSVGSIGWAPGGSAGSNCDSLLVEQYKKILKRKHSSNFMLLSLHVVRRIRI